MPAFSFHKNLERLEKGSYQFDYLSNNNQMRTTCDRNCGLSLCPRTHLSQ